MLKTGTDGFYLFYDGQHCLGDGLDSCSAGPLASWAFPNGNTSMTITILGNTPAAATTATMPTPWTKADVKSGNTTYASNLISPAYTLTVASGSAYGRDWRFHN
jgi:hypothetical protein